MAWRQRLLTAACVVGVFVVGVAPPANAQIEDQGLRTYPATMCQVWGPDLEKWRNRWAGYSQFGRLANKSNVHSLSVVCPIIRAESFSVKGLQFVDVHFLDRHPLIDLECTVYSVDLNGETVRLAETQSHAGASDLFQRFRFTGINQSVGWGPVDNPVGNLYTLFCSIPPKAGNDFSWISAYVVREELE